MLTRFKAVSVVALVSVIPPLLSVIPEVLCRPTLFADSAMVMPLLMTVAPL